MSTSVGKEIMLRRLAWGIGMIALLLALVAIGLTIAGRTALYSGWGIRGFLSILSIPFSIMGMLILRRFPKHGMGWVFLGIGVFATLQGILLEYMLYSLVLFSDTLPGGLFVAWLLNFYWVFVIALITLMLVLFPNGRLPSPRWRTFVWTMFAGCIFLGIFNALAPAPLDSSFGSLDNPYALEILRPIAGWVDFASVIVLLYAFGPPVVSLIQRFRHAQGTERQQYKWFVFAATLMPLVSVITGPSENQLLQSLLMAMFIFLPITIAIAILRHRLFDIDIIIRRTLLYSVLTAILATVYFGSVVALQSVVSALGVQPSAFVTVVSTLAIAALFTPLRRRVQHFIDRRFYRQKYDAEQTLAAFANTARDEVDMERLAGALLRVVEETMQPTTANLWLQPMDTPRRESQK